MDGASKFIRGDALLYLDYDCEHYWRHLDWCGSEGHVVTDALQTYTVLTGDGLAGQIPALRLVALPVC